MSTRPIIIPLLAVLFATGLLIVGPIPQSSQYHRFADHREFLLIPNFLNVITNLPFAIIGLLGLAASKCVKGRLLRYIFFTLFTGFLLLSVGSSYYHLRPANLALVYDRIPISIIFMSFFSFIIFKCVGRRVGSITLPTLNLIGILSVIYWAFTESIGKGDLRLYAMVQFFPIIAIPLLLKLYPSTSIYRQHIIVIFVFFALGKLSETFDKEIYSLLGYVISGHSLKHLFMAAAGYRIVVWVRRAKAV